MPEAQIQENTPVLTGPVTPPARPGVNQAAVGFGLSYARGVDPSRGVYCGVEVVAIGENSPLIDQLKVGDVILSAESSGNNVDLSGNFPVANAFKFQGFLAGIKDGQTVKLRIRRGEVGQETEVEVSAVAKLGAADRRLEPSEAYAVKMEALYNPTSSGKPSEIDGKSYDPKLITIDSIIGKVGYCQNRNFLQNPGFGVNHGPREFLDNLHWKFLQFKDGKPRGTEVDLAGEKGRYGAVIYMNGRAPLLDLAYYYDSGSKSWKKHTFDNSGMWPWGSSTGDRDASKYAIVGIGGLGDPKVNQNIGKWLKDGKVDALNAAIFNDLTEWLRDPNSGDFYPVMAVRASGKGNIENASGIETIMLGIPKSELIKAFGK